MNLDSDERIKEGLASWEWMIRRTENRYLVQQAIKKHKMHHFVAAKKWLYLLPFNTQNSQHIMLLVAEKMDILPLCESVAGWKQMDCKILDELYTILSSCFAGSWRPDNIALMKNGLFAFVDTEHKATIASFERINRYLDPELVPYWESLVRTGGSQASLKN
jgi:hypothetical protein